MNGKMNLKENVTHSNTWKDALKAHDLLCEVDVKRCYLGLYVIPRVYFAASSRSALYQIERA